MMKVLEAAPLPITILAISLACPTELSLYLGGLRLPPHRVALIVLLVTAIIKQMQAKPIQLMASDSLMLADGLWQIGVFMYHEGEGPGLQYGGSLALESFASYFVVRIYVTTLEQLKASVNVLVFCVLVVGALAAMESISHQLFVHAFLLQLTGYDIGPNFEIRNGLMRAFSTFDHPILYGSFCACTVALAWATTKRTGPATFKVVLIVVVTYFGMSSAPLLCCGVQIGLLVWERMSRGIPKRATLTVSAIVVGLLAVGMVSNRSPFAIIATGFTLDPWTGFYRLLIWQHGLENVARSPLFGIGLGDWTREFWMASDSVDAFWLVIMMRMGVPALAMLMLAITLLLIAVHNQRIAMTKEIRRLVIAWTFSMIALSLAGCTVHYWNNIHAYFFFLLGLMAWVGDPRVARKRAQAMARAQGARAPAPVGSPQPARPPFPAFPPARPAGPAPLNGPLGAGVYVVV